MIIVVVVYEQRSTGVSSMWSTSYTVYAAEATEAVVAKSIVAVIKAQ
jgi:hypothetical protein